MSALENNSEQDSTTKTTMSTVSSDSSSIKILEQARLTNLDQPGDASTGTSISGDHKGMIDFVIDNRTPEETQAIYNMWAPTYETDMTLNQYKGPIILAEYLSQTLNLNKTAEILDIGCGTGLVGDALKNLGFTKIDGLDISQEMMTEAKKKACYKHHFNEKVVSCEHLILRKCMYDCVVLCGVLQPGHVLPAALQKLAERLTSNGYLVSVGPLISDLVLKSDDFKESTFTSIITELSVKAKLQLQTRSTIPDYRKQTAGELLCFKKE